MIAKVRFAPTRLTRTFASLLGGQISARAIRIVYIVVLARLIEPSQLGLYLYGVAVYVALLGLAGFGQSMFLAARIPQRSAPGNWLAHSLTIRLGATGLAGLAGLIFVWTQEGDPSVRATVALFLGALVARSIAAWIREAHVALEDAGWIPRYEATFRMTEAVLGVALVVAGLGVVWLAALHFAVWTIEAAASVRRMRGQSLWPGRPGHRRRLLLPMIGASFWYMVGAALITVFGQEGIVGLRLLGVSADWVGQFAIAVQGLLALVLIPSTLAAALVPALSRTRRLGIGKDQRAVTLLLRLAIVIGAAVAVLMSGYAAPIVSYVLGARYGEAALLFTSLSWAAGPLATAIIAVQALNALGLKRRAALIPAIMVAIQAVVLAALYPLTGLDGASMAMTAGAIVGAGAGVVMVGSANGVRGQAWWLVPFVAVAGAAASMHLVPLSAPTLSPIVFVALVAVLGGARVFEREELDYIARRFVGGRSSADDSTSS